MGISPLSFVGISNFSNDFQTILSRAVQIAELPIKALQNRDADVLQQKTLFSSLSASVASLATSLTSLGTTAGNRALTASSSNTAAVTVTNSGATAPASYTINEITSVATAASERTLTGYADSASTPVSSTGDLRLVVGSQQFDFTVTNNSLVGIRDAINGLGAGVTATILTTADGNYLSVSANGTGQTTLALHDDPAGANTNLLTAANQGANAVFKLNGIDVSQSTNLVNSVIPGLTFTLQAATASPVTLSLATSRTGFKSALEDFVAQYNGLREQANTQVGEAAGLLSGNHLVRGVQAKLREIASYRTESGDVTSLAGLGIEFDNFGVASLNAETFDALTDQQINSGLDFIGTSTTGLGAFAAGLKQYSDPITGLIKLEQDGLDRIDAQIQDQIDAISQRVELMRLGLQRKLQLADTLLATLESQQTQLSAALDGLNLVLYGRNDE